MEKLIEDQVRSTKLLMTAVEVTKASDNHRVEELFLDIKKSLIKADALIAKRKDLLRVKRDVCNEIEELKKKCSVIADLAETINQDVFQGQSHEGSLNSEQGSSVNGHSMDNLEVSPCPSQWANGALFTPVLKERNICQPPQRHPGQENGQHYLIKSLHSREFESVPAYMKGRLACQNVNSFITILNSVIKQKYSITCLKRKDVKRKDLTQYCTWKSQEVENKMIGHIFFSDKDIINLGNLKLDKSSDKMFQILRHTKRLRQSRVSAKLMLYILT